MSEIKQDLLELVQESMIPEVEAYLEELHELIKENKQTDEDMEEIKEMETFLVELQNIILAIKEDKIDDIQAEEIYENIANLVEGEEE
ncbi:hypothetical protein [Malaciobacter mytili]|uniref:Uncharacterized protein n=2 Tax=Malaciobacter mytili TaxID=603050 RepID=A0AAX2AK76_9BACT|nr:hypothetical protein [Malaciobacter mytili]AXH14551.1 hypothetical protein AMYT_0962 [Malaciobacter mytili LMG 24559]RXK16605.1 hypothetical protein CP985_02365 [Malaciobacter mytili LMG 24559]